METITIKNYKNAAKAIGYLQEDVKRKKWVIKHRDLNPKDKKDLEMSVNVDLAEIRRQENIMTRFIYFHYNQQKGECIPR